MVTSKGVGLAVPDWPTTFGYNMFLFPVSKWVGGIFFEHTHRLIASIVGFLTIVLAIWIWRVDHRRWLRNLGFAALGAVILQGVLGGLRVTLLKDEIGVFHALLAQAFLGMVIVITLATSRFWRRLSRNSSLPARVRALCRVVICTTIVIYLQLGLGATMRHQHRDLSILDFPFAYGKLIPDTSPAKVAEINTRRDARAMSDVTPFHIWLQMRRRVAMAVNQAKRCSHLEPRSAIAAGATLESNSPGGIEANLVAINDRGYNSMRCRRGTWRFRGLAWFRIRLAARVRGLRTTGRRDRTGCRSDRRFAGRALGRRWNGLSL